MEALTHYILVKKGTGEHGLDDRIREIDLNRSKNDFSPTTFHFYFLDGAITVKDVYGISVGRCANVLCGAS